VHSNLSAAMQHEFKAEMKFCVGTYDVRYCVARRKYVCIKQ